MDKCTHKVRAQYWQQVIQACQQRPAGQSAKSWLDENGIREQSYYSWQRKFRQEAYLQLTTKDTPSVSAEKDTATVSFVEIALHKENSVGKAESMIVDHCVPTAVLRTESFTVAITNDISDSLLSRLLREVSHA